MVATQLGLILISISSVLVIALPRQLVGIPFFAAAFWIPIGQYIDIGGFHFYFLRIISLVGISRIILRREYPVGLWNSIDKTLAIWVLFLLVTSIFHKASFFTIRLGIVYDTITIYALFRCIITEFEDFTVAARAFSIVIIPIAVALIIERNTGHNWFSALGGVEEFSQVRDGIVRAQGPFSHAINAGIVGTFNIGLSFFLFPNYRKTAICGFFMGVLIIYASSSSGPVMGAAILIVMSFFYPWREYVRKYMVWATAAILLMFHLAMKAPVWYLIARLKIFGGSTSWYRAQLIDSTFEHISEWWLYGTDNTILLMPFGGLEGYDGNADITSQYIKMMVLGGFGLFFVYVLLLYYGFKYVSDLGRHSETGEESQWCPFEVWAITSILVFFTLSFVTISYFGKIPILWTFIIAAISSWWSATQTQPPDAVE